MKFFSKIYIKKKEQEEDISKTKLLLFLFLINLTSNSFFKIIIEIIMYAYV